jgi:hypothetical protein
VVSAILSGATLAGGLANPAPCPNINRATTCNVVITAGPGGSFVTTVPNASPYDGSDDNPVGIINNSGSTITSLSFIGSGGGGLFAFDGDGLQSFNATPGGAPDGTGVPRKGVSCPFFSCAEHDRQLGAGGPPPSLMAVKG